MGKGRILFGTLFILGDTGTKAILLAIDMIGNQRWDAAYWWRCFIAAAQRMIKKPIQSAACWKGIAS